MNGVHVTAMRARLVWLPVALALLLGGCDVPRAGVAPCVVLGVGADAGATTLVGQVRAPRSALGPGPVDGAPLAESPVAGAAVYLADGLGTRLPGLPATTTDAEGRYRLEGVPGGHTYVVVAGFRLANDRPGTLKALARPTEGAVTAELTLATSLVTAETSDALDGFTAPLDAGRYAEAIAQTQAFLTNDRVPDLSDDGDVLSLGHTLLNVSPAFRGAIMDLRQSLAP